MTRQQGSWWRRVSALAVLGLLLCLGLASAQAVGLDPAHMSSSALKALQQRLTDAGCYKGAIDGTASDALDAAIKSCPDQRPFLRIETGTHTAQIRHIGVDAACRLLATASDDKTVRLWSLPEGKLQRVVRLPIGEGDAGKSYATALSPDGRWLAAGGWDAAWDKTRTMSLTMVDLSSGLIRRFGSFEGAISYITFSADGRRVAVGLGGNNGVRVLDSATGVELLADRGYGDNVYWLAFAPDGALIASSFDGQLRRYGPDLKLTVKRFAPDGNDTYSVAIDPSGRRVAVGYYGGARVSILDAMTLVPIAKTQAGDLRNGDLRSVAWSRDSATLVAGGGAQAQFDGQLRDIIRRFDATGRHLGADIGVSGNTILDIRPCGDGFVFATFDSSFGLLSAQGVATTLQGPRTVDMRDKLGPAFSLSPDAASVRFGLGPGNQKPVIFDLFAASLKDSPDVPPGFAPARVDGFRITDWENSYVPKFNGSKLVLEDYEKSLALAIRPDTSGFVLGTAWWVRAYDAKGKQRWQRPGPGEAAGVDFSADSEILAVAYNDGTIRWLRWTDGEELLALFVEPQTRNWVAWTPTGYHMSSPGGEDLIGWHVNRGWDQEADFFAASEFRAQYRRTDIVRLVLQTRDEAEAVRRANAAAGRAVEATPVATVLPPVVAILSPAGGSHFSGDSVEIAFSLRSPSDLPIDRLDALADGQAVPATGFERTSSPHALGSIAVRLPQRDTTVSLIAHSADLTSAPVNLKLVYDGPTVADQSGLRLYALLAGVTGYANRDYDTLQFPARDAESLAKVLEAQRGGLYSDVRTKLVDVPTRENVLVTSVIESAVFF